MADAAPAAPTEPRPTLKVPASRPLLVWVSILTLGLIVLGAFAYHLHTRLPDPTPAPVPPDPVPPPRPPAPPSPADVVPKAVVSGMFLAVQPTTSAAGNPPAPRGLFRLDATGSTSSVPIHWKVVGPDLSLMTFDPAGKPGASIAEAIVTEPGTYRFCPIAVGTVKGRPVADADVWIYTVGGPTPVPPDPGPGPGPNPPVPPNPPPPPPPPAPIPGDGLRVLFLYESADLSKYDRNQISVMYGGPVREYLDARCAKVNNTPEYRIYDKDVDVSNESDTWKKAIGRGFKSLPWIVVSDGKSGFEGELPKNPDDTLALIKKYGESK